MNTQQHTDQQPTAMTDTHKKPFVHLAYRKIMIDHLPLRDLYRTVKPAAVVLGAPVRVFYSGMAMDPRGTPLNLSHTRYHQLQAPQHPAPSDRPLLSSAENRAIR